MSFEVRVSIHFSDTECTMIYIYTRLMHILHTCSVCICMAAARQKVSSTFHVQMRGSYCLGGANNQRLFWFLLLLLPLFHLLFLSCGWL